MIVNNNKPSNTSFQANVMLIGHTTNLNSISTALQPAVNEINKLGAVIPNSAKDTISLMVLKPSESEKTQGILSYFNHKWLDAVAKETIESEPKQLIPTVEQWVEAAKNLIQKATGTQPTT